MYHPQCFCKAGRLSDEDASDGARGSCVGDELKVKLATDADFMIVVSHMTGSVLAKLWDMINHCLIFYI